MHRLFVAGPPVVSHAMGVDVTKEELGGWHIHSEMDRSTISPKTKTMRWNRVVDVLLGSVVGLGAAKAMLGQPIRTSRARPKPPGEQSATQQADTPYRPALRERLESRWQHFNPPPGFRPYWDHHLQRTVNPRQHAN